eukprot:30694-Pelagococcus_subviridis.AAC.18
MFNPVFTSFLRDSVPVPNEEFTLSQVHGIDVSEEGGSAPAFPKGSLDSFNPRVVSSRFESVASTHVALVDGCFITSASSEPSRGALGAAGTDVDKSDTHLNFAAWVLTWAPFPPPPASPAFAPGRIAAGGGGTGTNTGFGARIRDEINAPTLEPAPAAERVAPPCIATIAAASVARSFISGARSDWVVGSAGRAIPLSASESVPSSPYSRSFVVPGTVVLATVSVFDFVLASSPTSPSSSASTFASPLAAPADKPAFTLLSVLSWPSFFCARLLSSAKCAFFRLLNGKFGFFS